ncbi:Endoglucanase-4 [Dactylellina cionopaga]|nr:Endoglucanase-4 [Dactylellina cionopaga]
MICNVNNSPLNGFVNAKSGDKITFQWFKENTDPSDIVIDPSHVGPVTVFMADMSLSATGQGAIWTKVYEDGQVGSSWALTRLRDDPVHGKQVFVIPPKLKSGNYLVRAEIIALHEAYDVGKAQFYPSCSQFKIAGPSDGIALPGGFNFIGGYKATDPSIHIDVYAGVTNYKAPGRLTLTTKASTTKGGSTPTTTTGSGDGGSCVAEEFKQCGGSGWTGCTKCPSGQTCQTQNNWYYQCLP